MVPFREIHELLLLSHSDKYISDEEFILLYGINQSRNPDFPYWLYNSFDIMAVSEAECWGDFRMYRNDVLNLAHIFNIPDEIHCKNRTKCSGVEAFCIFLKRFAYPCRYGDMIQRFGRSVSESCLISNYIVDHVYNNLGHKLTNLNQPWLSPIKLQEYATAIHQKGAPLQNCWEFIDGTVRPICRLGEHQRIVYNGHKRVHSLKFQSVIAPNGLIVNLFGPMEGRRHDCAFLNASGLLTEM